jgi:uncharacterized protein YuzE
MATLKIRGRTKAVASALALAKQVAQFPAARMWLDYDAEAEVLYISFRRPQQATNTVEEDDGLLLRFQGKELVGVTVLDASKR